MAKREGIGEELALGVKLLSEKYGGEDCALHVKGLEYPQYKPRGSWGMSLAYAVSDRGACHMRAYAPNEEVFAASIPPFIPLQLITAAFFAISPSRISSQPMNFLPFDSTIFASRWVK